jgi:hypothetical protein
MIVVLATKKSKIAVHHVHHYRSAGAGCISIMELPILLKLLGLFINHPHISNTVLTEPVFSYLVLIL